MKFNELQLQLDLQDKSINTKKLVKKRRNRTDNNINKLDPADRKFHDWYRFVLSFPPHLVGDYISNFQLKKTDTILDPFCGTGTTLVESKLHGIQAIGVEANPFAHFASSVKVDWSVNPDLLTEHANEIAEKAYNLLLSQGIDDNNPFVDDFKHLSLKTLDAYATNLLLTNSISPVPLHKTLVLLDCIKQHYNEPYYRHVLLALAKALVLTISNLRFGPEVGVGKPKIDIPVISSWLTKIKAIANDIRQLPQQLYPNCLVYLGDARRISKIVIPNSVDAVITSPPYPNEKDYTRTTRLESVILGFINNLEELRKFKKTLVRSNTRGVYKGDDDDKWIANHKEIQQIADEIEKRRIELGKTSGFEKLYGTVTKLYFGGMGRHFSELRKVLRPGAQLAYVVGDQASYLRIKICTGQLLAEIAQSLGYELVRIDLFRTRFASTTGEQLREEIVVLRWPG